MSDTIMIRCPHCGASNRVPDARLAEASNCGRCHELLFTGRPLELDQAGFDQLVATEEIPLLVDFWASWCGPCQQMAPAFIKAAGLLEPQLRLAKVDTEAASSLAARFNIRSIPTLILFRSGKEIARQPGAMSAEGIVRWARSAADQGAAGVSA